MPCQDFDNDALDTRRRFSRLDKATRVACLALRLLEDEGRLPDLTKEARAWWREHKRADEARRDRERVEIAKKKRRKTALAKLTAEEVELLGLKRK